MGSKLAVRPLNAPINRITVLAQGWAESYKKYNDDINLQLVK